MKNSTLRRTDVLFLGSLLGLVLVIVLTVTCNIKFLVNFFHHSNGWVTFIWMIVLTIVILPTRFFPKTKWAKWWNTCVF